MEIITTHSLPDLSEVHHQRISPATLVARQDFSAEHCQSALLTVEISQNLPMVYQPGKMHNPN